MEEKKKAICCLCRESEAFRSFAILGGDPIGNVCKECSKNWRTPEKYDEPTKVLTSREIQRKLVTAGEIFRAAKNLEKPGSLDTEI